MTKKLLNKDNIKYEEINVEENSDVLEDLKSRGFKSVPILSYNDEEYIVGFQVDKLRAFVKKVGDCSEH
jgi:hypothetical protein